MWSLCFLCVGSKTSCQQVKIPLQKLWQLSLAAPLLEVQLSSPAKHHSVKWRHQGVGQVLVTAVFLILAIQYVFHYGDLVHLLLLYIKIKAKTHKKMPKTFSYPGQLLKWNSCAQAESFKTTVVCLFTLFLKENMKITEENHFAFVLQHVPLWTTWSSLSIPFPISSTAIGNGPITPVC